ncbi:MAG: hypothetical protein KGI70_02310 [Patescibacteria group bacterium]|nr:hypothetical protein [Patescibacteria group bacterium]
MVPQPVYLNWEYILTRSWDFVTSAHPGSWPVAGWIVTSVEDIIIVGMGLSLIFLILLVYAQIRLVQVEHAGYAKQAEEERAKRRLQAGVPGVEESVERARFARIQALSASPNPGDWRRAVIDADVMLAEGLAQKGFTGQTVADQLKQANPFQLTTLDIAWKAHKVRNDIAHGGEAYALSERDTRATIEQFHRVFEELGMI